MIISDEAITRMRPTPNHDERARQSFDGVLRKHLREKLMPAMAPLYENRVLPEFQREHGRPPANKTEVRRAMTADNFYRHGARCSASASSCCGTQLSIRWSAAYQSLSIVPEA